MLWARVSNDWQCKHASHSAAVWDIDWSCVTDYFTQLSVYLLLQCLPEDLLSKMCERLKKKGAGVVALALAVLAVSAAFT